MKRSTLRILIWISAALMLQLSAACTADNTVAYSHFEEIPAEGWDPVDLLIFEPWPTDSAEAQHRDYSMDLVLRFSNRKHISLLPIALTIEDENGTLRADTLILRPDSAASGLSSRTQYGVREISLTLDSAVRLSHGYSVSLSPLTPPEASEGLLNIGLILK